MRVTSSRLALADFRASDLQAVHAYGSDPLVSQFAPWGPNSHEESGQFLVDACVKKDGRFLLAICLEGRVIGSASVWVTDESQRIGELGYTLHRDFWGQGLGTEVARMLVRLGTAELALQRIMASCDVRNMRSRRVLEKVGLKLVGRIQEPEPLIKGRNETLVFAVDTETNGRLQR